MSAVDRLPTSTDEETETAVEAAAAAVRRGDLVVIPTDTVYGIAADAFSHAAVRPLLDPRRRGQALPPPLPVPSVISRDPLAVRRSQWARAPADAL